MWKHLGSMGKGDIPSTSTTHLPNPRGESRAHIHRRASGPCNVIDYLNATLRAAKPSHPTGQAVSPR